jgi:uroporphyrinogen-III synthase
VAKTREARDRLNEDLNPKGISVGQVLVRYFRCSREIQKNIEEKKPKDRLVFTNQAAARAASEEVQLKKIIQKGRVAVEGKQIMLAPVSEGGLNLKSTDINRLIDTLGIKSLPEKKRPTGIQRRNYVLAQNL